MNERRELINFSAFRHRRRNEQLAKRIEVLLFLVTMSLMSAITYKISDDKHQSGDFLDQSGIKIEPINLTPTLDLKESPDFKPQEYQVAGRNLEKTLDWMRTNPDTTLRAIPDTLSPYFWSTTTEKPGSYAQFHYIATGDNEKDLKVVLFMSSFNKIMTDADIAEAATDLFRANYVQSLTNQNPLWFVARHSEIEEQIRNIRIPSLSTSKR